jgi:putative endonuclease
MTLQFWSNRHRQERTKTAITGQKGEEVAANYLQSLGYSIRERNARFGRLEIDIVAFDRVERMIVFVEVKTRTRSSDAYPIRTALNPRKRTAIRAAAYQWLLRHQYEGPARTDLVTVCGDRIVEHLRSIGSDFY